MYEIGDMEEDIETPDLFFHISNLIHLQNLLKSQFRQLQPSVPAQQKKIL